MDRARALRVSAAAGAALEILQFKLDLLRSMLDAMMLAYCQVELGGWG